MSRLPCRFADATVMVGRIIGSEAYQLVGDLVDNPALPIDDAVRPRIQLGRGISARDYLAALAERDALKRRFLAALDGIDALLTPTTQTAAIRSTRSTRRRRRRISPGSSTCWNCARWRVPDGFTADRAAAVVADHLPAL